MAVRCRAGLSHFYQHLAAKKTSERTQKQQQRNGPVVIDRSIETVIGAARGDTIEMNGAKYGRDDRKTYE